MKNTPLRIVRNDATSPKISATREGDAYVVRVEAVSVQAPDELVVFPFGLERAAASRAIRDGHLKAARLGRRLYARRSDVLSLVDKLALGPTTKATPEAATDYDAIVAQARGRRR